MTSRPEYRPGTAVLVVRLEVGNPRGGQWCPACKAYTGFAVDLLVLQTSGVRVLGTAHGCEICDDTDGGERG
ncbi:hypothetical protein ABZT26_02745 [Streptomyces sp. NPDC005395]|uniref:hypothetical protein n=1 Tax=Streptomyces sp. NPDC005395 TaxID=3157042 RepID=UPI0033A80ACA